MKIAKKSGQRNRFLTFFVAVGIIFFLMHKVFFKESLVLEQCAGAVFYPFLVLQNTVLYPFKSFKNYTADRATLVAQISDLQAHNDSLQAALIVHEGTQNFLEQSADVRMFEKQYDISQARLCQIIMHRFNSYEHAFFIDGGTQHGIAKDMVVVYKNMIVGKVVQTYQYYSKAVAITDKTCKVSACCANTKTLGIFQGCGAADKALLLHVDRLKQLQEDDLLLSTGEGTIFPGGFALGKVVSYVPNGVYYDVHVEPLVSVENLSYCYVMHKGAATSTHSSEFPDESAALLEQSHALQKADARQEMFLKSVQRETVHDQVQPTQEPLQ